MKKAHERSHYRFRRITPAFPAQWFYGLLRALPGDQACLTPSPALLIADLTPASGRQNHTTSPSAAAQFVKRTARVHRIPPRVRDVRTPLCWDGTVRISELICLGPKQKYFCKRGWTGHFGKHEVICPSGKISLCTEAVITLFPQISRVVTSAGPGFRFAHPGYADFFLVIARSEATKQSTSVIPGWCVSTRPQMCNGTSGNLEIPGSMLRIASFAENWSDGILGVLQHLSTQERKWV